MSCSCSQEALSTAYQKAKNVIAAEIQARHMATRAAGPRHQPGRARQGPLRHIAASATPQLAGAPEPALSNPLSTEPTLEGLHIPIPKIWLLVTRSSPGWAVKVSQRGGRLDDGETCDSWETRWRNPISYGLLLKKRPEKVSDVYRLWF